MTDEVDCNIDSKIVTSTGLKIITILIFLILQKILLIVMSILHVLHLL